MIPPFRCPVSLVDAPSFSIFSSRDAGSPLFRSAPAHKSARNIHFFRNGDRARFVAAPRIFQWRQTNGQRFFPRRGNSAAICLSTGNSWPYVLSLYRGIENGTLFKAVPTTSHFSSSPPLGAIALNECSFAQPIESKKIERYEEGSRNTER